MGVPGRKQRSRGIGARAARLVATGVALGRSAWRAIAEGGGGGRELQGPAAATWVWRTGSACRGGSQRPGAGLREPLRICRDFSAKSGSYGNIGREARCHGGAGAKAEALLRAAAAGCAMAEGGPQGSTAY
jgi:hypothetical protein